MRNQVKHTKVLPPIGERLEAAERRLDQLRDFLDRYDAVMHQILAVSPVNSEPAKLINQLFESLEKKDAA